MFSFETVLISATMVLSLLFAPLAILATPYAKDEPALAIIPPWTDKNAALVASGLVEIAPLRAPFGALVDASHASNAAVRRSNGVWLLLDGSLIAALCGETDV